jgi:hypothetical protein
MAIRRTKEDKQRAQIRREASLTYSWQAPDKASRVEAPLSSKSKSPLARTPNPEAAQTQAIQILGYSPSFIYQDLLKTMVVTVVCVLVLVGIKLYVFP